MSEPTRDAPEEPDPPVQDPLSEPTRDAPEEPDPPVQDPLGGLDLITLGSWTFRLFGAAVVVMATIATFEDPAAIAGIVFGLVFVGIGVLMKRLFATPEGKRAVSITGPTIPIQTHTGATGARRQGYQILVPADASEAEVEDASRRFLAEQWAQRADWAAGRLEHDNTQRAWLLAFGAGVWSVISVVLWIVAAVSEDPVIRLAAIGCSLVTGALLLGAGVAWLRSRKFPPSVLVLARTPVLLGERLVAELQTGVAAAAGPADGFHVELECVHRWEERRSAGSGETHTHRHRDVLWRTEVVIAGEVGAHPPYPLTLPIDLELPTDAPSAALISSSEGIVWALSVHGDVPGLDYRASFELPIFAPADDPTGGASS